MKGLELARLYYDAYGREMLYSQFADVMPFLAVGLAGSGSECFGYDDDTSHDHDFEPGFCIFLPDEDTVDRRTAFLLERAYAKLPKEFSGIVRSPLNPVGGNRHGVIRMDEFFEAKTGRADGELTTAGWFTVPEQGLLEATNGAVFDDPFGRFSAIRQKLSRFPEDVRRKKLAGHLLLMGQAGQYNYPRCVTRGDTAAAQLAVFEFVRSALHVIYLLNNAYTPYYKWRFRGLKELSRLSGLADDLELLISVGNTADEAAQKTDMISRICAAVADELQRQELSAEQRTDMEAQAYAVNNTVTDPTVRNAHILCGV